MNNLELLEFCKRNPEKFLDVHYMFVERHRDLALYGKTTRQIKNLLITIKEIKNRKEAAGVLEQIFYKLHKILKEYANYSEFGSFINACDSTIDEVRYDMGLLRKITFLYLQKRDLNDIVPIEWIQALIDKGSSRKKGSAGENKLIEILGQSRYKRAKTLTDFLIHKHSFARNSSGGDFSNISLRARFGEHIGGRTQHKKLDLIIKSGEDIYFLEAKHMNVGGGGQNKQILELVEVIRKKPKQARNHFVGFLDGIYFNKLFNLGEKAANQEEERKILQQRNDIMKSLHQNPGNYFINTAGFIRLFHRGLGIYKRSILSKK